MTPRGKNTFGKTCMALAILASGANLTPASADAFRAYHQPHIVTGEPYRKCYARSVPANSESLEGWTQVYQFTNTKRDKLLYEFDWYGLGIYLNCPNNSDIGSELSLVRRGMWPIGDAANADELALEFYYSGKLVASYSTLDIAGSPENVRWSASHYRVIAKIIGFEKPNEFSIVTVDGRTITFNTRTGKIQS